MLTTLSIVSLDQGKIAPRYDVEPKSTEEMTEAAVSKMEIPSRRLSRSVLAIWHWVAGSSGSLQLR